MDRDTELALVERLKAGDAAAFEEVHAAFNTRLFTFLVRLSRRREVAEDLLEDTWLRLVSRAHALRSDTRLGPWLFTVARNRYFSYCRSRLLEASHATNLMGLWPSPSRVTSPFEDAAASEIERRIESALASLPATYREVLLLVGVEGLQPIDPGTASRPTRRLDRRDGKRGDDMTAFEPNDPIFRRLARLPPATPDPLRTERVRERCLNTIARRARRSPVRRAGFIRRSIESAVVGGFSVVYLAALVLDLARLYGAR